MSDLIDRQAAIDATWKDPSYTDPLNVLTEVRDRIKALPSVQSVGKDINVSCKYAISRQAALELGDNLRDDLPDDEQIAAAVMAHNEGIIEYQTKLSLLPSVQPTHINTSNTLKSLDCVDRQAVIDALSDWYDGMIVSSFRGIEKVIKALPSVQPEPCSDAVYRLYKRAYEAGQRNAQPEKAQLSGEGTTSDCVSRQAAIDAICKACSMEEDYHKCDGYPETSTWCDELVALRALPSVQPEIVPCGDCKHWICHDRRCGYWNHGVKPLEWCCHAERKENR